jgi:hypothetical protein
MVLSARLRYKGGSLVEGLAVRLRDPRSGWDVWGFFDVGAEAPTYLRSKGSCGTPEGVPLSTTGRCYRRKRVVLLNRAGQG